MCPPSRGVGGEGFRWTCRRGPRDGRAWRPQPERIQADRAAHRPRKRMKGIPGEILGPPRRRWWRRNPNGRRTARRASRPTRRRRRDWTRIRRLGSNSTAPPSPAAAAWPGAAP
eukprot:scaffold285_cov330-Pavlova_lutheri.AAC.75